MAGVKFSSITFSNIKSEIERYLRTEHNKANVLFSPASPYGQILSVIENLHQLSILYLKNSISQFDLSNPNSLNERVIRNAAIFAGHNPGRAISATGTLKLTLKSSADLEKDVPGGRISFNNKILLRNSTNSLEYSVNLGTEKVTHRVTPNYQFFLPIIQGKWITKNFTGDGTQLQTISLSEVGQKDIENFNVEVIVNGDLWSVKKHIWEMLPDEQACVVRTGFNGGVDIVFGNEGFGSIPPLTALIEINYLLTDGSIGNIFRRTRDDWKFVGDVIDGNGETIDVTNVFNIDIYTDINFGADAESILFTKNILPIASNNFVLGLPQQYAYEIKKLGVFSHVNAYEKTGTIFIVATPNIRLFKNQNADYFTIDIRAFELDRYEKSKIDKYLKTGGNIQLTKKYRIDSPTLSYYTMNVFVISYSDATDDSVNAQILDKISEYFLDLKRIDRIPKLDLIRELSTITDIHSVDIQFICKKNEDYHRENITRMNNKAATYNSSYSTDISAVKPSADYNAGSTLGIDPTLGDIIFEPNEIPVIRGGWYDRNGIYYTDSVDGNSMKSVNIIKKGVVDSKNRPNT
jgi:hypothetical protein